jgi:hypothetical protein
LTSDLPETKDEYQLQILMRGREQALAQEWRKGALLREAKEASRITTPSPRGALLMQTILRTLTIALLIVLLALSLTTIARAQAPEALNHCVDGQDNLSRLATLRSGN